MKRNMRLIRLAIDIDEKLYNIMKNNGFIHEKEVEDLLEALINKGEISNEKENN